MRPHLFAFLLCLFGVLPGCNSRGRSGVPTLPELVAASVLGGGRLFLDPFASRLLIGSIVLQNTLAAGIDGGDIVFRIQPEPGMEPEETEVVVPAGQQRTVPVFTTLVAAAVLQLTVFANYSRGGTERPFPLVWNNEAADNRALALLALVAGQPITSLAALWYASALLAPVGVLTNNSNRNVVQRVPALAQDIRLYAALIFFVALADLQGAFGGGPADGAVFPPGAGPEGFTVAATPSAPLAGGEQCFFWFAVREPIPLADPQQLFQYAFVVDSDTNPANNWVASPAFADDFFAGTDRWYELNYTPAGGWQMRCRQVGPGNTLTTVASAARVILSGDTMLLVVPRSEFAVANPPFRATTFAHLGDFGQNPPFTWSGDPTPTVAEGLRSWQ